MGISVIRSHAKDKEHKDKMTLENSSSTLFFTREKEATATPTSDASQQARKSQTLLPSAVASVSGTETEILCFSA